MSDLHARRLLVFLLVAAVALTGLVVSPFWEALFLAAVLAATLRRPMEWTATKIGGRRQVAAGIVTLGVLLAVVVPLAALATVLVTHVIDGVQWLRDTIESEGVRGLVQRLPGPLERAARELLRALPRRQQEIQKLAGEQGGQAAAAVGGVLSATGSALFQTAMMLVSLFFFLADGRRLVGWIDSHMPLRPGQFRALIEDFRQTSVSVLIATVGTAGIQTLSALAGYLIARVPNVLFLTLVTFVVALIPALGGTVAVIAVALLMLATGHTISAIFLAAWGLVVVAVADNVARPYMLKGELQLHGGLVFFALLGGLAVFGGVGLVLGPLVMTFLVATARLYRREFGQPPAA